MMDHIRTLHTFARKTMKRKNEDDEDVEKRTVRLSIAKNTQRRRESSVQSQPNQVVVVRDGFLIHRRWRAHTFIAIIFIFIVIR